MNKTFLLTYHYRKATSDIIVKAIDSDSAQRKLMRLNKDFVITACDYLNG